MQLPPSLPCLAQTSVATFKASVDAGTLAASGFTSPTFVQIQVCAKNLKVRARTAVAKSKAATRATGGGPPAAPVDATLSKVYAHAGASVKPLANSDDSDRDFFSKEETASLQELATRPELITNRSSGWKKRVAGDKEGSKQSTRSSKRDSPDSTQELINEKLRREHKVLEAKEEHLRSKTRVLEKESQLLDLNIKEHQESSSTIRLQQLPLDAGDLLSLLWLPSRDLRIVLSFAQRDGRSRLPSHQCARFSDAGGRCWRDSCFRVSLESGSYILPSLLIKIPVACRSSYLQ